MVEDGLELKHADNATDFWDIHTIGIVPILAYLRETTAYLPHWEPYQNHLWALQLGVEHWKG